MIEKKSNYFLASAFKLAPLGSWEWDVKLDKLILSEEVFKLIDRKSEEFDGTVEFIVNEVIDVSYRSFIQDNISKAIKSGIVPGYEYLINKSDGTQSWIKLNGFALRDESGTLTHLLGTLLDITDRKQQEISMHNQNSFYKALMAIIPNPIFYKDKDGVYQYCNAAFSEYIGMTSENIIGSTVYDVAPKELADGYHKADLELMYGKKNQSYESPVQYADGSLHDVLFSKSVQLDKDGQSIGIVGLMNDITMRKNNERLIDMQNLIKDVIIDLSQKINDYHTESELYNAMIIQLLSVFNHAESGTVLQVTEDGHFIIISSSQYDEDLMNTFKIDMKESFIWHHCQGNICKPGIVDKIDDLVSKFDVPETIPMKSNNTLKCNLYIPLLVDGRVDKIISLDSTIESSFTELDLSIAYYIQEQILIIQKLYSLNQQTIKLSRYDSLTGFMNRSFFEAVFEDRLETAIRKHTSLTLVMFDLDNLKKLNDCCGHAVGDEYIRQFSKLLYGSFRASDQFARIGGDEFCGAFLDTDVILLEQKLNVIRESFSQLPFGADNDNFIGRFSYGIAIYPMDGQNTFDLMHVADSNMYLDKITYKNKG